MTYSLPQLRYDYDALAPHISKDIMQLHHSKHHQTYVDKLNTALGDVADEVAQRPLEQLLADIDSLPQQVQTTIRNNGGGHYNHSLFWQSMSPRGGTTPSGDLGAALDQKYGSFAAFVEQFTTQATGLFGSGWVWLQPDLELLVSANQDSALMTGGPAPLMGLDVWEHAYYLDYKNVRADYIKAWWNVVDWQAVEARYHSATKNGE